MKFPYLRCWDTQPITVYITEGLDDNGSPAVVATYTGLCNFNEKVSTRRSPDGQSIQLNASVTIGSDIAPAVKAIAGYVLYKGKEWKIYSAQRPSNPDGTANHTRLELI